MIKLDAENKQETNKFFTKVLDKFIDKKENSQDVFIWLKSQLELKQDILGKYLYQKCLKKITDDFVNSDSV